MIVRDLVHHTAMYLSKFFFKFTYDYQIINKLIKDEEDGR